MLRPIKLMFCDTETTDKPQEFGSQHRCPGILQLSGSVDYLYKADRFNKEDMKGLEKITSAHAKPEFRTVDEIEYVLIPKEEFNFFIKPFEVDTISDEALQVNKITRDMMKTFSGPEDIFFEFRNMLLNYVDKFNKADKFIFVAYNARFDDDRLREFWKKNNDNYYGSIFHFPPMDVMNMALQRLIDVKYQFPNFKLETVCNYFKLTQEGALHDAMVDIKLTKKLFLELL